MTVAVLITGASRGLGLALVSYFTTLPNFSSTYTLFAAARSQTPALKKVVEAFPDNVIFIELEVTSEESVKAAAASVEKIRAGQGLDILINNAGIMSWDVNKIEHMSDLPEHFNVNVLGVHRVTAAFMPLLRQGKLKKVINISTTLGSFAKVKVYNRFPVSAYKISKAALNMLTVQYALNYADEGFIFVALSPGWLKTDMGTENADLPVEQGAKACFDKIHAADQSQNGAFNNILVEGWENADFNQYDGLNPAW